MVTEPGVYNWSPAGLVRGGAAVLAATAAVTFAAPASAQGADDSAIGVKAQAGGRWDRVRMCIATPPGTEGGPAFDIVVFAEKGIGHGASFIVDLPVMRPVLFGVAFDMLQLEPVMGLNFRDEIGEDLDLIAGPRLGATLHYGPDYRSGDSGDERLPSFFAMGPRFGAYLGLDFVRPAEVFNFQLGLHPYLSPMWAIDDPDDHRGTVVGAMAEGAFRFSVFE